MELTLAIAAGGALGAVVRVVVADVLKRYPLGATALVNIVGSFIAGVAISTLSGAMLAFVSIGVCGAMTTFSTFANEVVTAASGGETALAAAYAAGTAAACLTAAGLGLIVI